MVVWMWRAPGRKPAGHQHSRPGNMPCKWTFQSEQIIAPENHIDSTENVLVLFYHRLVVQV